MSLRVHRLWPVLIALLLIFSSVLSFPAYAQDGGKHVVQAGENLFRIALRYGVSVDAIARANGITNTAQIAVGQVLVIPSANNAPPPANNPPPPEQAANPPNNTGPQIYTVQPGDTLNKIAQKFGLTWQELINANGLTDPNVLRAGQQLRIPGKAHAEQSGQPAQQPPQQPAPNTAEKVYVVKRGEGLAAIARQHGVSLNALVGFNNIGNPNLIYAGMVVKIPDKDYDPKTTPLTAAMLPEPPISSGKAVLVILRQQRVYIYENGQLLRNVLVSTGLPGTPTVQGDFKIYVKYRAQTMYGPGYYLPSVPYVMYFFQGYGLHGTYWHSNFGRPMSHGCVNLPTPEAQWIFAWAEVGTPVYVRW